MRYTGTQLNQYDADVFFEVLQRARRTPLGTGTTFAGADFLRSIGRTASKSDYEDMDMSLRRLARGLVDVKWRLTNNRTVEYTGSLVAEFIRETDSRLYRVNLAPAIKSLFEPNSFTMIEWEQRKRLLRNPLAQWLHSYYSTHANPFTVKVQFLQRWQGRKAPGLGTSLRLSVSPLASWKQSCSGQFSGLALISSRSRILRLRARRGI